MVADSGNNADGAGLECPAAERTTISKVSKALRKGINVPNAVVLLPLFTLCPIALKSGLGAATLESKEVRPFQRDSAQEQAEIEKQSGTSVHIVYV